MDVDELKEWLRHQSVGRTINHVQLHHTWKPDYSSFSGQNHFALQKGMKASHIARGFDTIGQHFSIFPDGMICTGRSLARDPACIKGHNTGGICIECIGDFDDGEDSMRPTQKTAIVEAVALLCHRFSLKVNDEQIVYHHWFDAAGARTRNSGNPGVKSCPGTNFFGGNKEADAKANLFPLISTELANLTTPPSVPAQMLGLALVDDLNVRKEPSPTAAIVDVLEEGEEVRIASAAGKWFKLTTGGFVFAQYVDTFRRAKVAKDDVRAYKAPKATAASENAYDKGEVVRVFEEVDGFGRVTLDSRWVKLTDLA